MDDDMDTFENIVPVVRKSIAWQIIVYAQSYLCPEDRLLADEIAKRVANDNWK